MDPSLKTGSQTRRGICLELGPQRFGMKAMPRLTSLQTSIWGLCDVECWIRCFLDVCHEAAIYTSALAIIRRFVRFDHSKMRSINHWTRCVVGLCHWVYFVTCVYLNKWYISHGLVGIVPKPRHGTCQRGPWSRGGPPTCVWLGRCGCFPCYF